MADQMEKHRKELGKNVRLGLTCEAEILLQSFLYFILIAIDCSTKPTGSNLLLSLSGMLHVVQYQVTAQYFIRLL